MHHKKREVPPRKALAVSVSVIGDRDATAAWATIVGGPYTRDLVQAAGSSKRKAGDPYNARIASDLAVGRALVELGLRLQASGEELVQLEADVRFAEQLLAGMNRTQRAVRATSPHPGLLSLSDLLEQRGLKAAEIAAERRGMELELAELLQERTPGGRDNGLPTITSDTGKDTS